MIFNSYSNSDKEIYGVKIISCGHIFAKPGREILRPLGREDWLLFFVANESETFYLESIHTAAKGSFVIFAPHEKQHHKYLGDKTAEFYYIHFKCRQLPSEVSFKTSTVYSPPFKRVYCDFFEAIIKENLEKQPLYEELSTIKFLELLLMLSRDTLGGAESSGGVSRLAHAIQYINANYDKNHSLEDYAALMHMSKYHFLRVFKQTVGVPPLEYRNNIRLEHAAELIKEKVSSIEEIALSLGFSSLAYFSSAFKKKYGVSPKQYQNKKTTG